MPHLGSAQSVGSVSAVDSDVLALLQVVQRPRARGLVTAYEMIRTVLAGFDIVDSTGPLPADSVLLAYRFTTDSILSVAGLVTTSLHFGNMLFTVNTDTTSINRVMPVQAPAAFDDGLHIDSDTSSPWTPINMYLGPTPGRLAYLHVNASALPVNIISRFIVQFPPLGA